MKELKYKIKDKKLLKQVFTHRSFSKNSLNNERLEFLGDAVLSFLITDLLYKKHPEFMEGDLTKKRSEWVSGSSLCEIAKSLEFSKHLQTGEEKLKTNPRILAGALEAYIGTVYLEGGIRSARALVKHLFKEHIKTKTLDKNYKSILQEWCQKKYQDIPIYKVQKETGKEHDKTFYIEVFIKGKVKGAGSGSQKKSAEQLAAWEAIQKLKIPQVKW